MQNRKIVMQKGLNDLKGIPSVVWTKIVKAFMRMRLWLWTMS